MLLVLMSAGCTAPGASACVTDDDGHSVVQQWIEVTLQAVRDDFPAPTVHARNLYHLSAAMWDAWAAFDQDATGVIASIDVEGEEEDQALAISHAADKIARDRYEGSVGGADAIERFDELAAATCVDADPAPGSPGALGIEVADAVLTAFADDGSNAEDGYRGDFTPRNPPLLVSEPGTTLPEPNHWQPLEFEQMVTQNGIPLETTVQEFVGPHWGSVTAFALPDSPDGVPIEAPPPPPFGTDAFTDGILDVIRASSRLDPADGELIDVSPGALGNATLGTDDGHGHAENPVTGQPYERQEVPRADYLRVIAEIWADGPTSETPPGHWNSIAFQTTAAVEEDRHVEGRGEAVSQLEWDVKLALALNGALHDAAVAAWGIKADTDYVRPVSAIRHMAGLGQSSDPSGAAYHPDGLPLEEGLIEVITAESSAPGERHELLADHAREIAIFAWQRLPNFFADGLTTVRWIRGVEWLPYQMATFVTPAFAGYVSGHSTFSRAAAEVLEAFTGDAFFPGGVLELAVAEESLIFEDGPARPFTLQWATYADAADEAGRSRIAGGIHVPADDYQGRIVGAEVGQLAWARAQELFGGS